MLPAFSRALASDILTFLLIQPRGGNPMLAAAIARIAPAYAASPQQSPRLRHPRMSSAPIEGKPRLPKCLREITAAYVAVSPQRPASDILTFSIQNATINFIMDIIVIITIIIIVRRVVRRVARS